MGLILAKDFALAKSKYLDVIEHTPGIAQNARWVYGRHPSDALLRAYLDNDELYFLMDQESIVGMVAIVLRQGEEYDAVSWAESLAGDQVATLHLLAVCPERQGQALGRRLLEEAVAIAVKNGKKAVRLDTLQSNLPAQRLYERAGFSYRGTQYLYAENTGWVDFLYYEKTLPMESEE